MKEHKTAFLCSRKCPSDVVLKSLDWARQKKAAGRCVISGFHRQGEQPIIVVLARGLMKRWPPEIKEAVAADRMLVISPFDDAITHITQETANKRNQIMVDLADEGMIQVDTYPSTKPCHWCINISVTTN